MKHRKLWIGSGLALLIVAMITIYVIRNTQAQAEVQTVQPAREEIREEIVTSGVLEAGEKQEVYLDPERGELSEIPVKPGKKIQKGTTLVRYRNDMLNAEKQQAEMQIETARVKRSGLLRQLEEVRKADTSNPASGAPGGGAMSEEQIRQEIRLADLELKQVQKQLETVRKRLERLTVKSTLSGTVIQVNPSGGRGASAEPLVIVADLEDLKVIADVSELDVLKVKKGQTVTIRSDALPDKAWKGEVIRVADLPGSDEQVAAGGGSAQVVYPVEVRLEGKIPLKLGSNLIVEIAAEKRKALTLPQEAVREEQGKSHVFVVEKGKAVRREVKVGISDGDRLEIRSGVKPGETVVLNPPEDLKSGVEVKTR